MIDYEEELRYNRQEKDRIKAEINDLESRIIVESGRHHRYEVNNYRARINRLKMRLNEISLRIVELEKMAKNAKLPTQIKAMPTDGLKIPPISNGEITITDTIEFDTGFSDIGGETIQTVTRHVERKIIYKNNEPVSVTETLDERVITRKLGVDDAIQIRSSIVE